MDRLIIYGHPVFGTVIKFLLDCWESMKFLKGTLYISKTFVKEEYIKLLKEIAKIDIQVEGIHYVFNDINFAQANFIRYSYFYPEFFKTYFKFFRDEIPSRKNFAIAMLLTRSFWVTSDKSFGGVNLNLELGFIIDPNKFEQEYPNIGHGLFSTYSICTQIKEKDSREIADALGTEKYSEAVNLMQRHLKNLKFKHIIKLLKDCVRTTSNK